jgi:hypothetical protein
LDLLQSVAVAAVAATQQRHQLENLEDLVAVPEETNHLQEDLALLDKAMLEVRTYQEVVAAEEEAAAVLDLKDNRVNCLPLQEDLAAMDCLALLQEFLPFMPAEVVADRVMRPTAEPALRIPVAAVEVQEAVDRPPSLVAWAAWVAAATVVLAQQVIEGEAKVVQELSLYVILYAKKILLQQQVEL